jgi:copper(I)-binding protein
MRPAASMKSGGTVPVTLVFADGGTLEANFAVKGANGK